MPDSPEGRAGREIKIGSKVALVGNEKVFTKETGLPELAERMKNSGHSPRGVVLNFASDGFILVRMKHDGNVVRVPYDDVVVTG